MDKNSKIYVAGHRGLVGSSIVRKLKEKGYYNLIFRTHSELDLTNQMEVSNFFKNEKPEYVFLAAAKVGGIMANNTYRAQFIFENLQIQNNVIHNSYLNGVKKLIFLGSSCIYPRNPELPIREEALLTSELEYTNEPYAIAKITGVKMCESYNIQYGTNFLCLMPTNLYGPFDNYDLEKSHVLPAVIRKMHLGKSLITNDWKAITGDLNKRSIEGVDGNASQQDILQILKKYGIEKDFITLWGSGAPYREFLHSDDMADASVYIFENTDFNQLIKDKKEIRNTHINIGSGTDLTIKQLAELVKNIVGYNGILKWDSSKPDGTFRKLMDSSKLNQLGWQPKISLEEGIRQEYQNYFL